MFRLWKTGKKRKDGETSRKKWSRRKRVLFFLLFIFLLFFLTAGCYALEIFVLRGGREVRSSLKETNTTASVYKTEAQLEKHMEPDFPDLTKNVKSSIVIPGLNATKTLMGTFHAVAVCTSMTPQGMAVSEDYIFISAYCHTHRHNSVIYMLNRRTHDYIKTIVLPGTPHAGGLAYDPANENLWVSGGSKGAAKAIAYSLQSLKDYDLDTMKKPIKAKYNYTLATITRNSYMAYANGALLIGYFSQSGLSQLERFDITDEGGLHAQIIEDYDSKHESVVSDFSAITSGEIQAAAESGDYILLSKSFGLFDSALQIFDNSSTTYDFQDEGAVKVLRFPPKLEQICTYDEKLYCLFESAAYAYRAQPELCLDRVLVFDLPDILPAQASS